MLSCTKDKVTTLFTAPEALQLRPPAKQPPFTAGEGVTWLRGLPAMGQAWEEPTRHPGAAESLNIAFAGRSSRS